MPYVVVYKGLFGDINKTIDFIKRSENNPNLQNLTAWESFGNPNDGGAKGIRSTFTAPLQSTLDQEEMHILSEIIYIRKYTMFDYIQTYADSELWPVPLRDFVIGGGLWDYSGFDIVRYDGQEFDESLTWKEKFYGNFHVDKTPFTDPGSLNNVLTTMIYINDDYLEGNIEFLLIDGEMGVVSYKPEAGDVVFFPSFFPFFHAVKMPFNQNRYAIRTFLSHPMNVDETTNEEYVHMYLGEKKNVQEVFSEKDVKFINGKDLFNE